MKRRYTTTHEMNAGIGNNFASWQRVMRDLRQLELTLRHASWNIKDPSFAVSLAFNLYSRELAELVEQIAAHSRSLREGSIDFTIDQFAQTTDPSNVNEPNLSAHPNALCIYLNDIIEQFREEAIIITVADESAIPLIERAIMLTASIRNWLSSYLTAAAS